MIYKKIDLSNYSLLFINLLNKQTQHICIMSITLYKSEEELDDGQFRITIEKISDGHYWYERRVWRDYDRGYGNFHTESEYSFNATSDNLPDLIIGIKAARKESESSMSNEEILRYL